MRSHYAGQYHEITRDIAPEEERAQRSADRLSHLSLHGGADERGRSRGHVVEYHDSGSKKPFDAHSFGPDEGVALIEHLARHGKIKLPGDLVEYLRKYVEEQ